MKNTKTTLISIKLDLNMYRALKEHCEKKGIYMTILIQQLIGSELKREKLATLPKKERDHHEKDNYHDFLFD